MIPIQQSPSSRDVFAGPMVQISRVSVITPAPATDRWVPRMKRGMTGFGGVNS
ncbi:hypothetical protein J2X45_000018 [Caulobacter sp. BE264]|nr:hypothetical protein [Caulobacter sp. BE264]